MTQLPLQEPAQVLVADPPDELLEYLAVDAMPLPDEDLVVIIDVDFRCQARQ
jgi:hypothetical protein